MTNFATPLAHIPMAFPPYRLSGVVYGTLLNHRSALEALGEATENHPYKGRPKAPVLYVKPRNTIAGDGDTVVVPRDAGELEVGASIGIVIGKPSCRLDESTAAGHIAGYILVNDVSVPHLPYYRPSVRYKARDGFCPIGPQVVARGMVPKPEELIPRVFVDGQLTHESHLSELLRPVNTLLSAVTDFMSLSPGDILTVGVASPAPRVKPGQSVSIEADGFGRLRNTFVGEMR